MFYRSGSQRLLKESLSLPSNFTVNQNISDICLCKQKRYVIKTADVDLIKSSI